ncbi:ORF944 [White spot syndrome virus]|uniref:ORF944 n=1 Tax=White spot syndrome virus TaxID=342409 RepID=A0A2D3I604_9VIRU|nr:ORF944 [White spot syndrome virus]
MSLIELVLFSSSVFSQIPVSLCFMNVPPWSLVIGTKLLFPSVNFLHSRLFWADIRLMSAEATSRLNIFSCSWDEPSIAAVT